MTRTASDPQIQQMLLSACAAAREGRHNEALALVRSIKQQHKSNVYLLAFERQLEQLREYTRNESETEIQRRDIFESLPALAERAAESPDTTPGEYVRAQSLAAKANETAAIQWLVAQYLQHAYAFLVRAEYANALAEVHRIFVIDAANERAREVEQRVLQLMQPPTN